MGRSAETKSQLLPTGNCASLKLDITCALPSQRPSHDAGEHLPLAHKSVYRVCRRITYVMEPTALGAVLDVPAHCLWVAYRILKQPCIPVMPGHAYRQKRVGSQFSLRSLSACYQPGLAARLCATNQARRHSKHALLVPMHLLLSTVRHIRTHLSSSPNTHRPCAHGGTAPAACCASRVLSPCVTLKVAAPSR